jgi:hypothetical protein
MRTHLSQFSQRPKGRVFQANIAIASRSLRLGSNREELGKTMATPNKIGRQRTNEQTGESATPAFAVVQTLSS